MNFRHVLLRISARDLAIPGQGDGRDGSGKFTRDEVRGGGRGGGSRQDCMWQYVRCVSVPQHPSLSSQYQSHLQ